MIFEVQTTLATAIQTPCLILPVWQSEELGDAAREMDEKLGGLIGSVRDEDGFKGTMGETKVLYAPNFPAPRLLLLGLGKRDKFSSIKLRQAVARGARAVRSIKRESFALVLPETELSAREMGQTVVEGIRFGLHVWNDYKSDDETKALTEISSVTLLASDQSTLNDLQDGMARGDITASANIQARAWVNLPSNAKSPQYLAFEAQRIAQENDLRCEVWDEDRIREEKMGALFAVGVGSDNPPRFIVLEYAPKGHENEAPIILVGKGMSFDSGGYSLKPPPSMEDMKDDMAGAAVALASMQAIAQLKPKLRVLCLVASAENMISGRAMRPGDIIKARNGLSIEVLNTDAEGRLVLADALSYASEQKPRAIVDFATLTGAIGIALGNHAAGLFANDDDLAQQLLQAGDRSGDRVWQLPLWDEYRDAMKGHYSDLQNISADRGAGSIVAAVFLEKFVDKDIPWAHLDIAGVSLLREDRPLSTRGATGFGVRLVVDWIEHLE